jgi:hypothetical protein
MTIMPPHLQQYSKAGIFVDSCRQMWEDGEISEALGLKPLGSLVRAYDLIIRGLSYGKVLVVSFHLMAFLRSFGERIENIRYDFY